jgi:hypothetical protein
LTKKNHIFQKSQSHNKDPNSITNTTEEEEEQQQEEDGRELMSWRWEWEVMGVKGG